VSDWAAIRNARSDVRLKKALPSVFPTPVLIHAYRRPLLPPTPRLAIDSYWRMHPIRADRLARALASRSGAPEGWSWRLEANAEFRHPPAPYREKKHVLGRGFCCVCGQPIFRFGWHVDLWGDGKPNGNAVWHACCVVAWKLWTAPREHLRALRKAQGPKCPVTGKRLLKSGEVDHRTPLYQVWRENRDAPWPTLLAFWGAPNLQVINRAGHLAKCQDEARERAKWRQAGSTNESLNGATQP
jgi:hypothetical protein